jgi:hypothetical protein
MQEVIKTIINKLRNIVKRGYITDSTTNDSSAYSVIQVSFHGKISNAENYYPYGYTAMPPEQTTVLLFGVSAQSDNLIGLPYMQSERWKGLEIGEVIFGNPITQSYIKFLQNNDVKLFTKGNVNVDFSGLTPARLLSIDANKNLKTSDLINWVRTHNLTVVDDTNGGVYVDMPGSIIENWTLPLLFGSNTASIQKSDATHDGYLSASDWGIFNGKEPAIAVGTAFEYWRGDKTWQALNATAVGLGNVTNDTQTKAAIVPNTSPASGQILIGNAGGTAYAPQTVSNDISLTSAGAVTIANNVVTNAKLAQSGANTYKGNNTGVTANLSDIATNTAFNQSFETSTANIKPNGTVSVGALSTIPRADHIHAFSATLPLAYNAATGDISLGARSVFISVETSVNFNNYRTRSIGAAGNFNFNFFVPNDFTSLVACYVQGFVSAGAATTNRNIDIDVQYNSGSGQLYNQFTASDTATVYNLTGLTNRLFNLPVTSLLTSLVAGSVGGIKVTHNTLGGGIDYIGVLLIYV